MLPPLKEALLMKKKHYSDYIEEFLGSGQTVRQFATDHGMKPGSFRTALWRRNNESRVPVVIAPPDSGSKADEGVPSRWRSTPAELN